MIRRDSKDKLNLQFNILKEIGYVILLITFFVGILVGTLHFKNVDTSSFKEYEEILTENITKANSKEFYINSNRTFYQGLKVIGIYWIVGMSVLGTPILIGYLGYKGYSLGYTISTIIKILGMKAGNQYIFQYLFLKNVILVFIMIFLANFSIKISKNFFENRTNLKANVIKYTVVTILTVIIWLAMNFLEKIILSTF